MSQPQPARPRSIRTRLAGVLVGGGLLAACIVGAGSADAARSAPAAPAARIQSFLAGQLAVLGTGHTTVMVHGTPSPRPARRLAPPA